MRLLLLGAAVLIPCGAGRAHYHMLLPDRPSVKAGDEVVVTYQFGHPFEHDLSDTAAPAEVALTDPDGNAVALTDAVKPAELAAGDRKVRGFRITVRPASRGDCTLAVTSPPVWIADEKHFLRDVSKVVLHVQTQRGWDAPPAKDRFDLAPLTRPYGLAPGAAFRVQVGIGPDPGSGDLVEAERYNPAPPKALPPDEQITQAVKTDRAGTATVTLHESGWWAVTAVRKESVLMRHRDGRPYPVVERATLWVHVDEKPAPKPEK
jgi:cobalt/nickel transport protein